MTKINRDIFEQNIHRLGNRLGFLPRRITFDKFVTIDDGFNKILDELNIPYEEEKCECKNNVNSLWSLVL